MCNRRFCIVFILFAAIATHRFYRAEVFTAMSEMEELLNVEALLINSLKSYVVADEEKLNYLKRLVSDQRKHYEAARNKTLGITNLYLSVKRQTSDLEYITSVMSLNISSVILKNITKQRDKMKFPSDEDLNGAAIGLIRLQRTYNLKTLNVARGEINGIQYSSQMTIYDCFELGRQSYLNEEYDYAEQWMKEALRRFDDNTDKFRNISKDDIVEYYTLSLLKQEKIKRIEKVLGRILDESPNNTRMFKLAELVHKEFTSKVNKEKQADKTYLKLCRGETMQKPTKLSQLKCRYVMNNSAFLRIAPIKAEELNLKPYVVVFHDVLYDREIDKIKQMAKPMLKRSSVRNPITGMPIAATLRISKVAWIHEKSKKVIRNIDRRIEDMTALSTRNRDGFQVANYGLGGFYGMHTDYFGQNAYAYGDRTATVLFYMSDVNQGGATVFLDLKVSMQPKKGSALFWYNLHASGEADPRTLHAACPVLVGSKWAINIWLHEHDQIFRRPCPLKPNHK